MRVTATEGVAGIFGNAQGVFTNVEGFRKLSGIGEAPRDEAAPSAGTGCLGEATEWGCLADGKQQMTAKKKLNVHTLQQMKEKREPVVWVTAYDFITAQLAEQAGMDMILVGDSLGMCIYGYDGTIPVTMDQSIYHTEAVRRAAPPGE